MGKPVPKRTKQKADKVVELLKKGEVKTTANAMRLAGYTEKSVEQLSVGRTKAFQEYLATIDDTSIIGKWKEYADDIDSATDKRLAFDMGKEVVKLKDRNPLNADHKVGSMPILNMVFKDVTVETPGLTSEE